MLGLKQLPVVLLLGIATLAGVAHAAEPAHCLDKNTLENEVLSRFSFQTRIPGLKFDLCDKNNMPRRVAEAILFMKNLPRLSESRDDFDQGRLYPDPFTFFSSRIHTIIFETDANTSCSGVEAYVSLGTHDGIMHVCSEAQNTDLLMLSSALIHESRHQDGYPHVVCNHGFYATLTEGTGGCDSSYQEAGSYGIQVEYLVKVSRAQSLSLARRQEARAEALQRFMGNFNELPLGIRPGALLVQDDLDVDFYDGYSLTSLFRLSNPDEKIYLFSNELGRYDPKSEWATSYADGVKTDASVKTDFSAVGEPPKAFIDIFANPSIICGLYTDLLHCYSRFDFSKEVNLRIKTFSPHGFLFHNPSLSSDMAIYIVSKTGKIYSIPSDLSEMASARFEAPFQFKALGSGSLDGQNWLVLSPEGILEKTHGNDLPSAVPDPSIDPSVRFKALIAPYYWSEELRDL